MAKEKFVRTALELLQTEHDKKAQATRENQQIIIYIFVSVVIISAWILGTFQVGFLWVFFLILLTFLVWWSKVISLTEEHIKAKEIQVHRKRALRQSETAEWVNFILNRWWVFSSNTISDIIKRKLDPVLSDVKPSFLDGIELLRFSLGEKTPYVKYVHVYEYIDGGPCGKKPMSWSTIVHPPPGLVQAQQYQVVIETEIGLSGEDFSMIFRTKMGGKWVGMNLDLAVEKLNISGKMQFIVHLDMDMAFPHVSSVTMSFLEKPEVWFSVRVLRSIQMMEIPGLKSWIHHLVMDAFTQAIVDPGKVDIKFDATGPTNIPAKAGSKTNAQGVLTVTVRGEETKSNVLVEDTHYCQLKVRGQREHTRHMKTPGAWQDHCTFLIEDLTTDKLHIKSKTKVLLSTYTLAQFEVALADFPFEHRQICHTTLEEKSPKTGNPVHLELDMEYTALPRIEELTEKGKNLPPISEVSGVMYVCMHSAQNLLGLDRNGFSDPYCVLYSNGKKIKSTHYINHTKNPKWNISIEFTVADFTKTMLSFIVYDWDGSSASEDDFLGSAHLILTKDDPLAVRESLTLGYNLLNVGQVDNLRLGSLIVSAIFRPVASVAKSEKNSVMNTMSNSPNPTKAKSFTTAFDEVNKVKKSQRKKLSSLGDKKSSDSVGLGGLLAQGHGILELHIIQAKDLVAMDLNGYSDPYVDVKVNGERKFRTSVKKKTLDPVWNEFVTLQLPKAGDVLELIVWDKDAFFTKDFLGCLTFTLDDLKKYSNDKQHDGWFPLYRIKRGLLQIKMNIVLEDPNNEAMQSPEIIEEALSSPVNSESGDSGLPISNPTTLNELNCQQSADEQKSSRVKNAISDQQIDDSVSSSLKPGMTRHRSTTWSESGITDNLEDKTLANGKQDSLSVSSDFNIKNSDAIRKTLPITGKSLTAKVSRSTSDPRSSKISHMSTPETKQAMNKSDSKSPMILTGKTAESPSDSRYHGIQGQVLHLKGLQGNTSDLYIKIRFDNRSPYLRQRKIAAGHVIAKSQTVTGWSDTYFGMEFQVDQGHGVLKDGALIFDIKKSKKLHLVTKSFTLHEILGEHQQVTKWLPLDDTLQLEVMLHHANIPITDGRKQRSFLQGLKGIRGLQKNESVSSY